MLNTCDQNRNLIEKLNIEIKELKKRLKKLEAKRNASKVNTNHN